MHPITTKRIYIANGKKALYSLPTGISFDFKSYRSIPKKYLVLTLGLDTKGYFLGGDNFF